MSVFVRFWVSCGSVPLRGVKQGLRMVPSSPEPPVKATESKSGSIEERVYRNGKQVTRLMAMMVVTFLTNAALVLPYGSPLLSFINNCVLPPSPQSGVARNDR